MDTAPTHEELLASLKEQGRDGGDQHPDDAVLDPTNEEMSSVLAGLEQDDSTLKDA